MTDWIDKAAQAYCKLLELLLVLLLAVMVVMVFGNVVLRYGFNSGITVSEELSRWAFVWMIFLGAIVAIKDNGHLGTDMLVSKLSLTGKKVCLGIAEAGMLYCTWLIFSGSLAQTRLSWDVEAPVTGWSMSWLPLAGLVFAVSAALFHLLKLGRLFTGRLSEDELVTVQESEDLAGLKIDGETK
jgi:TRAP-type C4-dicarboxylate transport system permease small subunit